MLSPPTPPPLFIQRLHFTTETQQKKCHRPWFIPRPPLGERLPLRKKRLHRAVVMTVMPLVSSQPVHEEALCVCVNTKFITSVNVPGGWDRCRRAASCPSFHSSTCLSDEHSIGKVWGRRRVTPIKATVITLGSSSLFTWFTLIKPSVIVALVTVKVLRIRPKVLTGFLKVFLVNVPSASAGGF